MSEANKPNEFNELIQIEDSPLEEKSAIARFREEFEANKQNIQNVAILVHTGPDPDCIASAMGMCRILKFFNPEVYCSILYEGEVSHPLNKTMVNVLGIVMESIGLDKTPDKLQDDYQCFIAVDCLPERTYLKDVQFDFVVDHHRSDTKMAKVKDIRQVGATCSIIWGYMNELGIELDKTIEADATLATAMVLGIKTDTSDFVADNVTDLDFEAFKNLLESVNIRSLSNIVNYPIPPYHFDLRKIVDHPDNVHIENGVFIGGIGYISSGKRDALPVIAEERARQEGIDTSFIFAVVDNEIQVSVRSSGLSVDVNSLCQKIFGKEFAGGKLGAGAARIPMGFLSISDESNEIKSQMWESVRSVIMARILREMSNHR